LKNEDIHGAISAIMESMKRQGVSPNTLKKFKGSYNVFERYLSDNNIEQIGEKICLEYVYKRTGQRLERFECIASNRQAGHLMRSLLLLLRYLEDGQFHDNVRKTKPAFVCPVCFTTEFEAFCEEMVYRGYSQATIENRTKKVQRLIEYLVTQGVTSSSGIVIQHIENYLKTIENKSGWYVGGFFYVFKNFFSFLYERGYTDHDLSPMLPKVRISRNASIPYVWSKADLQKLLGAIDRADPKGKRDYAILLIAIRLGLRIGDIRNLKKSSINWNRKAINLKMSKTGQHIELPLLKDVGWAIIDYLQNGRPVTNSERLFVRHKAPFNAFGDYHSFSTELHRYILKVGLNIPGGKRHGMHSLRSTLAGNMLKIKSPLTIISEALGHQSIDTTSIYLKIDVEGLRKCALDPEEVFYDESSL